MLNAELSLFSLSLCYGHVLMRHFANKCWLFRGRQSFHAVVDILAVCGPQPYFGMLFKSGAGVTATTLPGTGTMLVCASGLPVLQASIVKGSASNSECRRHQLRRSNDRDPSVQGLKLRALPLRVLIGPCGRFEGLRQEVSSFRHVAVAIVFVCRIPLAVVCPAHVELQASLILATQSRQLLNFATCRRFALVIS